MAMGYIDRAWRLDSLKKSGFLHGRLRRNLEAKLLEGGPSLCEWYATHILKARWLEAEPLIVTSFVPARDYFQKFIVGEEYVSMTDERLTAWRKALYPKRS